MSNNTHWLLLLIFALLLAGSGCATTSAPDDWQSSAHVAQREAYGAWVTVDYADSLQTRTVRGELIAAGADSIFVLPSASTLRAVARSHIRHLRLETFDANYGYLMAWTALGTFSTLSHGFLLFLSAPAWIVSGAIATSRQSYLPVFTDPDARTLQQYARFPQGLPSGIDREALLPKPIE